VSWQNGSIGPRVTDPNRLALENAATKLAPFLSEIVFTGGAIVGLLASDPAAAPIRPTLDIDVIVEAAGYSEYLLFSERLRSVGFAEDSRDGAPICRWVSGDLTLDAMPLTPGALGFTNRWFAPSLNYAKTVQLQNGALIRIVSAPYFLATKLEAYRGRGSGDYFASHDLEDFIAVLDGHPGILSELGVASDTLRDFLSREVGLLLADERFLDALPGYLSPGASGQGRLPVLLEGLRLIAGGGGPQGLPTPAPVAT
jgi:hypothetical protein